VAQQLIPPQTQTILLELNSPFHEPLIPAAVKSGSASSAVILDARLDDTELNAPLISVAI
jgi:hypothetical protein